MTACHNGHSDVVELLLMAKVDVNASLEDGATAIYIACVNGHLGIVSTLLQFDADPNHKKHNGWSPLMAASENGHIDVLLKAHCDMNHYAKDGMTALYL